MLKSGDVAYERCQKSSKFKCYAKIILIYNSRNRLKKKQISYTKRLFFVFLFTLHIKLFFPCDYVRGLIYSRSIQYTHVYAIILAISRNSYIDTFNERLYLIHLSDYEALAQKPLLKSHLKQSLSCFSIGMIVK